jgi:CMP-N-acetylneuraminic acid synthetase
VTATPRIVALLPMRHSSERVPGKNYRELAGRPLYHYVVEVLRACPQIADVVIDTDSPVIMSDAVRAFPDVSVVERPEHLRDGAIPMNEILLNDVDRIPADLYLQTHSTNPLLRSETIGQAIDEFLAARPAFDSLFGVTRVQTRLWTADGRPINHDLDVLLRTQDLPPVYEENSCLYLFDAETLRRRRNRIGERPMLFEVPRAEAFDIDEEIDWQIVAGLLASRLGAAS